MAGIKVFVGSLPYGIQEQTVKELFEPYGQLVNAIVKPEQRYAFMFYNTLEEAQAAINNLNGFAVEGANIVVKLADKQGPATPGAPGGGGAAAGWGAQGGGQHHAAGVAGAGIVVPPPQNSPGTGGGDRIYVKGLPAGMTDQSANELFSAYGQVMDSKVLVADGKSNDGTGQSVAIIRMATPAEAQWLVENLNGNIPQGLVRPVEVSHAGQRTERTSPYGGGKGAGPGAPPPVVHHQQHHQAYAMPPAGVQTGARTGAVVPSVASLKTQVPPSCKLYIKGLPSGADDLYLYKVFAPWGRIVEAVALEKQGHTNTGGGTYCIGFVTFLTEIEAQEAIVNVNGVQLTDGATLSVSVKASKQ